MASMKWVKPSATTIEYFERLAPGAPLETRRMFGMPCRFLNGHMLVGVFENSLMLHLSQEDREACIAAGARPFKPMGREMKEYVEIHPHTFEDLELKEWIVRGMRYLAELKPKGKRNIAPTTEKAARVAAKKVSKKAKSAKKAQPKKKAKPVSKTKRAKAPSKKVAKARKAKPAARKSAKRSPRKVGRKSAPKKAQPKPRAKR